MPLTTFCNTSVSNINQLRKVTVVVVTHDLNLPIELDAKISIFSKGKLSEPTPATQIDDIENHFLDELRIEMNVQKKRVERLSNPSKD